MDTFSIFKVGNDRRDSRECSTISADPRKLSGVDRAINKKAPQFPEGLLFKVGNDRILSRIRRDSRECSTISADPRKSSGVNRAL
jgi:hypothetical protein